MAKNLAPDCGGEPVCKRLKTDLELTFSSHLELTHQLGTFEDCGPTMNNPPDCRNSLDTSSGLLPLNGDSPNDSLTSSKENNDINLASADSTEVSSNGPPVDYVNCSAEPIPEGSSSIKGSENEDQQTKAPCDISDEGNTGMPENEPKANESIQEDTVDEITESQESGSDEVEVVQTKINVNKKRKIVNKRKDIRKILSTDQLEEETLAAQREESERRQRQRLLQRQQAMSRVSQSQSIPFSMEDVMKRMANKGITVTIAPDPLCSTDSSSAAEVDTKKSTCSKDIVQEVFTLSSDDEESAFVPKNNRKYSCSNEPVPIPQDFYSGGVIMNNSAGIVSDRLKIEGSEAEIPTIGNQTLFKVQNDKGTESDSSDDCVVISPPPMNEEEDDSIEKYDDENNTPDELGRVLINVGHPPEDPDIFLSTQIAKAVKPHQIGGIRFLYDNVVESMERFNSTAGLGCILAHSMGLGKTIQAAAFCDVFLRYTKGNTVLVIVPINTVQNWLNEFNQWLPPSPSQRVEATCSGPTKKYTRKKDKLKKKNQEPEELNGEPRLVPAPAITQEEPSTSSANFTPEQPQSSSPKLPVLVSETAISLPIPVLAPAEEVQSPLEGRNFAVYVLNETVKTLAARERIISEWSENRGVLLIGYEMYRMLSLKKLKKCGRKEKSRLDSPEEENARLLKATQEEATLAKIYSCLVRPGPDLVICDEGHRIKNSGASISQALKAIKTRRRVVLTGYPLQNNLMEYWCMVDFIRPSYLGTKAEFSNMFERPITNGQCADSTTSDKRLMQFRSHVLHSLLEGFVQRRSHLVLQKALPPKQEWVLFVKMTSIQYELYKEFISYLRLLADMGNSTPNPIKAFAVCCKIWNHPDVLYNVVKKKQSILDDFEGLTEEVEDNKTRKNSNKKLSKIPPDMNDNNYFTKGAVDDPDPETDSFPIFTNYGYMTGPGQSAGIARDNRTVDSLLSLEWAASAFKKYVPGHLENGTKFELLFIIIEECVKVNDKLLVFSQSLLTLDLMEAFLSLKFGWVKGRDYFRLDGSTGGLERERLINEFNGPNNNVHVFLVSTRAGSLGINLIGANRVVVFDASWNPCHDCQAVCRVYRYGQKKECQIYRFVTDCTLEKRIYDRQINKRGMANRVVDEMNPDSHFNSKDMSSTLHLELDDLDRVQETTYEQDPTNYSDVIMQNLLLKAGDKITKEPFEHESLLIDRKEKKLSASERRMAHRNYEFEKKSATNQVPVQNMIANRQAYPSYFSGYPGQGKSGSPGPGMNGGDYEGSMNYMYGHGGHMGGYYDKPIASVRPIQQHVPIDYDSSQMQGHPGDMPPVDELRRRGMSVQGIVLRKDSYLADPEGGPDIFLGEGDKVYLLRSYKGSYLRLSNSRIIALRRRSRTNSFLDHIPPSQDLTKEQILHVINSIFRPRTPSTSVQDFEYRRAYSLHQNYREMVDHPFPDEMNEFPYHHSMSVPIPPSHPYGNFLNHQNLQITNKRNSSGGDVTIWKQDAQLEKLKPRSQSEELIPDIEVIKLNPIENVKHKTNEKLPQDFSSSFNGQLLPKNVPYGHNTFPRSSGLASPSNIAYPTFPIPDSRKTSTIVSALLARQGQRPAQKAYRGHSSHRSFNHGIPIQRTLKSPPSLPSELTIQPVPLRPNKADPNEIMPLKNYSAQASWMSSNIAASKSHLQNFNNFHPSSNVPEQYYSDESASGADFLEAGQDLLSEFINPTQNYPSILSRGRVQSTQHFPKSALNLPVTNSFHSSHDDGSINNGLFLQDKSRTENSLNSVSGNDNVFYEDSYGNSGSNESANVSHFGQYYCRNPSISAADGNNQSYSPQS